MNGVLGLSELLLDIPLSPEQQACLAAGMDGYLVKPLERSALSLMLDRYLLETTSEARSGAVVG